MIQNVEAKNTIDDCNAELSRIAGIINKVGSTDPLSGYLTKYSLIRICGTLEMSYKTIIADYYENIAPQLGPYITCHLRDASMNPTYGNICTALGHFDTTRKKDFKDAVDALNNKDNLIRAFDVLNRERNNVAHGYSSNLSFKDMSNHFLETIQILEALDSIMI
ncbi:MAG: hypothetical protein II318_05435 [Bacteroidales bacterium]|nr:hypothetical protein [Bacteroidales bacterium]